jgi:hypothetical protein
MGLKGAGSYFQQMLVSVVLAGLVLTICEVYLDDVITYGETPKELLERLRRIWLKFRQYKITLSPKKLVIGVPQIEYVGHVINSEGTRFSREKLDKVLQVPPPKTAKELKSFLGLANYFRDHIANYASIMRPLNELLHGYVPTRKLVWSEDQQTAFTAVKEAINTLPQLFFLQDGIGEIHLFTDASNYAIGAYLCQIIDGVEKPIAFMSALLNQQQILKWTVPEKECYAIVAAFKKFEYLIRDCHFVLHTDHKNLVFLKTSTGRVLRWKLLIQEYDFDIEYLEGHTNVVADSRANRSNRKFRRLRESNRVSELTVPTSTGNLPAERVDQQMSQRHCRSLGIRTHRSTSTKGRFQLALHETSHQGLCEQMSHVPETQLY